MIQIKDNVEAQSKASTRWHKLFRPLTLLAHLVCFGALLLATRAIYNLSRTPRSGIDGHYPTSENVLPGINLLQTSIGELKVGMEEGRFTSEQLMHAYLANIARDNRAGLNLGAITYVAPRDSLLRQARGADATRLLSGNKNGLGVLHGIPILVKDNMDTHPSLGMPTSAGSLALVIGKANMVELAGAKGHNRNIGHIPWSATGGEIRSAYVVDGPLGSDDPAGSSSGSAVGVSAGFAPAALGTDTVGSVTTPASRAGLFAIRSFMGLVPMDGVVPMTYDQDVVGPMAMTAADVGLLLDVMAATNGSTYFQAASTPTGWSDLRIGYLSQFIGMSQSEDAFYKNACPNEMARDMANVLDRFDELGAETFSVPSLFNTTQGWEDAVTLILNKRVVVGTGEDLPTYLKTRKQGNDQADEDIVRTIRDLMEFNDRHAAEEMPVSMGYQEGLYDALLAPPRSSLEFKKVDRQCHEQFGRQLFDRMFAEHDLDVLIAPADALSTLISAAAAYIIGTVPLGFCDTGRPTGLALHAAPGQEVALLRVMLVSIVQQSTPIKWTADE